MRMDQGCACAHLGAVCQPPRPLPGHSQATPRPFPGHYRATTARQLHQKKWNPRSRTITLTAGRQRMSGTWAKHRHGMGPSRAPPRPLPGPFQVRCFDEREYLGGKYGWKFETSMPEKGFILCWFANNNNNINSDKSSACI